MSETCLCVLPLLQAPLFKRRREIITGEGDSTDAAASVGIPGFWLQALSNFMPTSALIQPADEEALSYLQDIASESTGFGAGKILKLTFTFRENPYFADTVLVKTVTATEDGSGMVSAATPIAWKAGKCLTETKAMKKTKKGEPVWG
jgi:hypothetical protein